MVVYDEIPLASLASSFVHHMKQKKCVIKFLISKVALETFKQFSLEAILLKHLLHERRPKWGKHCHNRMFPLSPSRYDCSYQSIHLEIIKKLPK